MGESLMDRLMRLGIMGFIAVVVVLAVIGLSVYGFVFEHDSDLTSQLVGVLIVAAGALLGAVGKFFSGNGNGGGMPVKVITIPPPAPEPPPRWSPEDTPVDAGGELPPTPTFPPQ